MSFKLVPAAVKPVNLQNSVNFLGKLKGRDKAMRFAQYFARFLSFHLLKADPKDDLGERLKVFYKAVGLHRKAFKLGTFMEEYVKLMETFKQAKDDLKKNLNLALRALMTAFLVYDNWLYLISIKVIRGDADGIKKKSYYLRFLAALVNFILVAVNFKDSALALSAKPGDEKMLEKQGANIIGLIKNGCDLLTYGSNTNWFPFLALDDGQMGLFGAISAIAGGLPIWFAL